MRHAGGRRGKRKPQPAKQRAGDGHLPVRKLLEQRPDKQAGKVHHHVQGADDDGRSGGTHVQIIQQITEQQPKRRLNRTR